MDRTNIIQNTTDKKNPDFDFSSITPDDIEKEVDAIKEEFKPKTISARELLSRKIEVLPKLVDPIFPKIGIGCLAGPSDTGKSALLRQLVSQTANHETHFLGWKLNPEHFRAIYVSTEDDSHAISFLLHLQNKAKGYDSENMENLHYMFEVENLIKNLDQSLTEAKADLVVIDCLADVYGGKSSLNESTHVRSFLNPYKELAEKHECLILFLHHTGKRSEDFEPSKRNLLGSQGIEAKMRFVAELRVDPVEASKRHLCIVKGNYLPQEFKGESYELNFDQFMLFHSTGNRKPFEELQKLRVERSGVPKEQLVEQAKELTAQGKSQRQIAEQLQIGLATVNRYLNGSERSVPLNP